MATPLEHVRVLDLSRVMAGPWATQILADLGADVVKVERPETGDDTRTWGPPFVTNADGTPGDAGYFHAVNRGKRSVVADLGSSRGQDIVRALARRSDVVVENFKAGTLSKFGVGYPELQVVNPRLVWCSITGFGQSGPKRDSVAYDFMIQAMSGLMSITGQPDDVPGGGPQKVGVPVIDILTGMYAAVAVLAALARRDHTGEGAFIDIGMLDVAVATLANQGMNYLLSGKVPRRSGNAHPNIQPQDVFATRDGHVALAVGNDAQFEKFCKAIERPDLAADPRFATNQGRVRHLDGLKPDLVAVLRTRDTVDWVSRFDGAGIPCGPINTVADVLRDPQVVHREMVVRLTHAAAGTVPSLRSPIRFGDATTSAPTAAPVLGQHTAEILDDLELVDESATASPATGSRPGHSVTR